MLTGVGLLVVGLVGALVAVGAIAAVVARDRRRRNQVVPGTDTGAPASWAGAHTPEARLHRRLREAVLAARSVDDPDGALLAARVELERAAVAVDRHLVALASLPERLSASRTATAASAVASIEAAAASLADAGGAGRSVIATAGPGHLPEVDAAVEHARLLHEAIAELDAIDATVRPQLGRSPRGPVEIVDRSPAAEPDEERDHEQRGDERGEQRGDERGEQRPSTG